MTWLDVYHRAVDRGESAAGYYHHNIRVDLPDGPVIVRIPISGADMMDLHLWDEPDILAAINTGLDDVPDLLHVSEDPPFQIHAFITGTVLNDIAPRGTRVPRHVLGDVARLFAELAGFPVGLLPPRPFAWPDEGDTIGFARRLAEDSRRVFEANRKVHAKLYERLLIPEDPFVLVDAAWGRMTARPSVLVHSDVHRKNIIVHDARSFFLDWELALLGDPVYDLAVHLHKFGYQDDEQESLIGLWVAAMPSTHIGGYVEDLRTYLMHEQIKSVLVDSVRYLDAFAGGPAPYPREVLAGKLAEMLRIARRHWNDSTPVDHDDVADALRSCGTPL